MMAILFRVVPALLVAPVVIYLYFYAKRSLHYWKVPTEKRWVRLVILAACIGVGLLSANIWSTSIIVVLHVFMFGAVMELLNLALKRACKGNFWKNLYCCGLVPLAATLLVLLFGYWNMNHVVETDYTVYTQKDIRDEGYQIAFLSDLHYGISMDQQKLQAYADEIAEKQPDLVLLGGDIVDESTMLENMQQVFQILGSIPSTFGTYYVYGNHDRALYTSTPDFTPAQLQQAMEDAGVRVLSDETVQLSEDLVLAGREDISYSGYTAGRAPSAKLLEQVDPADFIVMLDHQPRDFQANQEAGADLQLSGHTHAGQIWPIGLISEAFHFNELTYGQLQMEGFQVIVSSGMAGWGYTIRTSGRSEYVMISVKENE